MATHKGLRAGLYYLRRAKKSWDVPIEFYEDKTWKRKQKLQALSTKD